LPLCVGNWKVGLGLAVGGADYICGLVDAALEFSFLCVSSEYGLCKWGGITFVSIGMRVGIYWVNLWVVASFAESTVRAV
jgi:hypothetical protein